MKTALVIAMIFGATALSHAAPAHHHARSYQSPPESFLGLQDHQRPVIPSDGNLGTCNGGPCTLTGGPSGGPNQS